MLKEGHFKQLTLRSLMLILFELKKANSSTLSFNGETWDDLQAELYINLPTSKQIDQQKKWSEIYNGKIAGKE